MCDSVGFRMIVDVFRVVRVEGPASKASDHPRRHHHLDAAEMLGVRASGAQALAHDLLEGEAEVPTEQGVDARINGGIAVAQPEEDGK